MDRRAMAQESGDSSGKAPAAASGDGDCSAAPPFKFNVHAPEFVPMSPAAGYYPPFLQLPAGSGGGGAATDWSFFADPDPAFFVPDFGRDEIGCAAAAVGGSNEQRKGASPADIAHKIIKQVEYQFSDMNLVANDFLMKIMNKDPKGYVPMSVISSWKKIKAMGVTSQLLVKALRTSPKLVVSEDGKKVRRAEQFTEQSKEELLSRMVIAENLPEDSTRNRLEKIFGTIGSVKNIRICHPQPQESSSGRSSKSSDALSSNKLHAIIEYGSTHLAEKAADKLNDERSWRKGLRVRMLLRRSPRSVIRLKRSGSDQLTMSDDEHSPSPQSQLDSPAAPEQVPDHHHQEDQQSGGKKPPWGRGRGRLAAAQTPKSVHAGAAGQLDSLMSPQQPPQGPRMPDGTRGFTMGRGRPPAAVPAAALAASTPIRAVAAVL